MFSMTNMIVFCKYELILILWLQHTPKKLGQRHIYHYVTPPFLLITLFNQLGVEDTNCWSFTGGTFAQSRLIQDSSLWSSLPTFWGCVAAIKIKICSYLQNTIMLVSENIGKRFFALFVSYFKVK